jgi:hypothetical protein
LLLAADSSSEIVKTPVPSGALINKMPDLSAWKISYIYDSEKKDPVTGKPGTPPPPPGGSKLQESIRSITVSRGGDNWVAISEDVKGNRLEQCASGGIPYTSDPRRPGITTMICPSASGQLQPDIKDFSSGSFPDLEWVTPSTYSGVQKFQEVDYLVFAKEDGSKAWVNAKTRFPAMVKTPSVTITFERLPNPSLPLILPEGAKNLIQAMNQDRAIFTKPRHPGS